MMDLALKERFGIISAASFCRNERLRVQRFREDSNRSAKTNIRFIVFEN
jgi:hypothetical protein